MVTPDTSAVNLTEGQAGQDALPLLLGYLDDVAARTAQRMGLDGGVAITMDGGADPLTAGSSNSLAWQVDQLQYAIGVGPCLHALRTGVGLYVPDLGADNRWRDYGPRAAELGAASCVSTPVLVGDRVAAVLKAYARVVDGISAEQQTSIRLVAVEVAGGIGLARHLTAQARELDDRAAAMDTRRSIDLAMGVLIERTGCTVAEAFGLLRRYSQQYNVKINEAAKKIMVDKVGPSFELDHAPFAHPGKL